MIYYFLQKNVGTLPPALLGLALRQDQVIKPCPQLILVLQRLGGSLTGRVKLLQTSPQYRMRINIQYRKTQEKNVRNCSNKNITENMR